VCSACAGAQYSQCDKCFFHDGSPGKINKIPVSNAPCQNIRGRRPVSGTGICFHSMNTGWNTGKGAGTVFSFYRMVCIVFTTYFPLARIMRDITVRRSACMAIMCCFKTKKRAFSRASP
ncbi:hypothetical protein NAI82_10365, partial [Oxalobacter sp. JAC-2022]|uniref:hypothetical protein n=1 Tax=Oxalobacter aliiformigenes TaxID=2946593 RepID=UPI0022AE9671